MQRAFQLYPCDFVLSQRSVKYIRWLHAFLFVEAPWPTVVSALRDSYELS